MAIIDVVKWDGDASQLAWKFDKSQELSTWTQLIVNESQEAVVCRGGAMDGPFGPGRHVLKTENLPILSKALSLPFGRSPFTAEVWFANKVIPLDVQWKTDKPIPVQDPTYKILIPVQANGQYGVQVAHTRKFLVKLVGTMPEFKQATLQEYLQGMILTIAKSTIAKEIVRKKVPLLEISTELVALSEAIQRDLAEKLEEFGLKLVNFFVSSIDVDERDPSIEKLRGALAKRAEMDIVGYSYQQEKSLEVLKTAAGNEGSAGQIMGAGIGLGAGLGIGGVIGQGFGAVAQHLNPGSGGAPGAGPGGAPAAGPGGAPGAGPGGGAPSPSTSPGGSCAKCNTPRADPNAKFCASCGTPYPKAEEQQCPTCESAVKPGAKFCGNCGTALGKKCAACGEAVDPGAKFCGGCGASQQTAA
jgi:membrane protease subunit (stomatin/prohibitin family)